MSHLVLMSELPPAVRARTVGLGQSPTGVVTDDVLRAVAQSLAQQPSVTGKWTPASACDPATGVRVFASGLGPAGCLPKSPERVAREAEIARLSKRYEALSIQEMTLGGQLQSLCKAQGGNYYDWGTWTNAGATTPTRPRCTFTYPASTGRAPDFKWGLDAGITPPPQVQALLDQLTAIKAEQKQINQRQAELNKPYEGGPCWPPVDCSGPAVSGSCGMRIGEAPNTIQNGQCVPNVEILKRQQASAFPADACGPEPTSFGIIEDPEHRRWRECRVRGGPALVERPSWAWPAVAVAGVAAVGLLALGLWRSQAQ
jgi:hypothetical protein